MRPAPFSRSTLVAAVELIAEGGHNALNRAILRLGLEASIDADPSTGVAKKADRLGRALLPRAGDPVTTLDGTMTLGEGLVREAVLSLRPDTGEGGRSPFERGLARDGFVVEFDEAHRSKLRAALPAEVNLPETDDEVHQLLKELGFRTPLGHLDQAVEAHTRGDWAACNAQVRTFLESLLEAIATQVRPEQASALASAENRRQLLAEIEFLAVDRKEWTSDGKSYINGLFKMLHTEGSHPGLSDEDHSTFRLHIVLITARTFLRRLRYGR